MRSQTTKLALDAQNSDATTAKKMKNLVILAIFVSFPMGPKLNKWHGGGVRIC